MDGLTLFFTKFLKIYIDWRVFLDILVMGGALFLGYRTLLRVGSWKIVVGIILATAVFALAHLLNLRGIRWAYNNLSQVAVIGAIVLFQPEIRKFLERAASLNRRLKEGLDPSLADLISQAAFGLASEKRGGLLVFPGHDSISFLVSGGYPLNAVPSLPLIMSIFDPNSPGHDGAVVVEESRLSRLGVRLPLSTSGALGSQYGTRHHAAMGLSEVADSLVVAVSEERGTVTTFKRGKFKTHDELEGLRSEIEDHWNELRQSPLALTSKPKTRTVFEFGLCLLLAVSLWTTLVYSQTEILERSFTVPVEFTATPANLALVGDRPTDLQVHLAGPKADLSGINPSQLVVKIDLTDAHPGDQRVVINSEKLRLPESVTLLDVNPDEFPISIKEIRQVEIPIVPQLVGKLGPDLVLKRMEVTPKSVIVLAPEDDSPKGTKHQLMTTPIYLESINDDTVIFCKIIAPPSLQPLEKRWPDVEVFIKLKKKRQ